MFTLTTKEYAKLMSQRKIGGVVVSRGVCDQILEIIAEPVSNVVTKLVVSGADEKTVHAAAELTATAIVRAITVQVVASDQISNCEEK